VTTPPSEHHLLVTHASRWAQAKKRPLDVELLETVLQLVTSYDDRSAQAWPPGSARNLVLHRWPANGPTTLPDAGALGDTLDTYWRFLRGTGRMTSASAAPADLVTELRRALPQMVEATGDRSNWSQGRVLQDFGASMGIELDGAGSMEELQGRLDEVMTAWNELPVEERKRLMPDPSPKTAMGVSATAMAERALGTGAFEPDPDDPASVYPHYRRGIRSVAIREAADSGFERKVRDLVTWLGEGKAVTKTGVLRPALAREAYEVLDLAPWERRYEAARLPDIARPELPAEAEEIDARARANAIQRAGDCLALDRIWYAAWRAERIELTSTRARPKAPERAEADGTRDALIDAITLVAAAEERFDGEHLTVLAHVLLRAMVAPDGEIDLGDVREDHWKGSGFAQRFADEPARLELFRGILDSQVATCVAVHDDMALWVRRGDHLTITDFGREVSVVVTSMADDWESED